MQEEIKHLINESIKAKQDSLILTPDIEAAAKLLIEAYNNKKKVLIAGNGGSAADAQHFAGEMVGRFKKERKSLPCIALHTDTSTLTAVGNDYGYDCIFERPVEAFGEQGDIFIGISTSGNSPNIIKAISKAKQLNLKTISLLGKDGGKIKGTTDITITIPSNDTPRIQEMHITILHILAELVENELFR